MQEKLYTVTELSKLFEVSRQTIHNWINDGRFGDDLIEVGGQSMLLIPASRVDAVRKEEADKLIEQLNRLGFQTVPA